jgi:hypothetical protein
VKGKSESSRSQERGTCAREREKREFPVTRKGNMCPV